MSLQGCCGHPVGSHVALGPQCGAPQPSCLLCRFAGLRHILALAGGRPAHGRPSPAAQAAPPSCGRRTRVWSLADAGPFSARSCLHPRRTSPLPWGTHCFHPKPLMFKSGMVPTTPCPGQRSQDVAVWAPASPQLCPSTPLGGHLSLRKGRESASRSLKWITGRKITQLDRELVLGRQAAACRGSRAGRGSPAVASGQSDGVRRPRSCGKAGQNQQQLRKDPQTLSVT